MSLVLHAAPLPPSSPATVRPSNELVTTTGAVYRNAEVERVMPDAIIISYTPAGGGWAMTRINLSDISPDMQQRFRKKPAGF